MVTGKKPFVGHFLEREIREAVNTIQDEDTILLKAFAGPPYPGTNALKKGQVGREMFPLLYLF